MVTALVKYLIRIYQLGVSPLLGQNCRYEPSCSQYAHEALTEHGLIKGSYLAIKRLLSCHPLGGHGYDPVPPKEPVEEKSCKLN